ncbi:glycosyltransferase, partial [Ideonella sp. B508-1]|uniref:glycosyltransferase n=1 Tax=Ideonella sp. B508-1 TaxID=137716 RepID=UPI0011D28EB7
MKILQIATGFPLGFPGGITNYVRSLAKSLKGFGESITILAAPGSKTEQNQEFAEIKEFSGVSSVFSLSTERDDKIKSAQILDLIDEHDVIHFHMGYGIPRSFYEKKIAKPYVVSLHDYGYICPRVFMMDKDGQLCSSRDLSKCRSCVGRLESINILRAGANRIGLKLPTIPSDATARRAQRMDKFLRNSARCLAVSSEVRRIFKSAIPDINCDVLHIGNDSAGPIPIRTSWMPDGRVRCIYLGTLNHDKGAEVFISLVEAVSHSRENFEFHFWGRGEEHYISRLRAMGAICHGAYKPHQLSEILKSADVGLVLPVWNDNGPQVLRNSST